MPQFYNLDANEALFFERQLEYVQTELYKIQYPELPARRLIPVSFRTPKGAKTITYRMYDMVGMAKIVANYATDFPRVSVKATEHTSPVKRLGDSYGYTVDDIETAAMANVPLEMFEAEAAKRGIMQAENEIAFFGDAANNLPGFLSNANIPESAVAADGFGASPLWTQKSPDLIIRDINLLINDIRTTTKGVERANTVVFPISAMAFLSTTPRSSTSDTTILQFLKANHPEITLWTDINELETAGPAGERVALAYRRDPMVLELEIPWDFEVFDPQPKGLEFEVPCSSKCGGTIVRYPLACNKIYGF